MKKMTRLLGALLSVLFFSLDYASAQCPFGADQCLTGYVWREASPTDHVCVRGSTRSQAAADNRQALARRDPNGGPFGVETCSQGFVWREAFPGDKVCVTGATRTQAARDNASAGVRRNPICTTGGEISRCSRAPIGKARCICECNELENGPEKTSCLRQC